MLDATACRLGPEVATVLGQDDLLPWFQRLSIPEPTRSTINRIRSSGPSRRVGGGSSNVCGRYPSKKMGVTIQFESHRVELAGIYEMEHDPSVLEYFDQPPPIKLTYAGPAGKEIGVLHTPDFFVIREREAGWEEWKTEEELQRLKARNPNRYSAKDPTGWDCPPGTGYAEPLGLYYRVRSSAEIDWTFIGDPMYVYVAAYTGGMAAENALSGRGRLYDLTALPHVIFTDPQVASVGLTEAKAREQGFTVKTSLLDLKNVPRALAARDTRGLIKLVAEVDTGRLLGAHVLADQAGEVIQEAVLAVRFGLTIKDIVDTFHPYLTMVEKRAPLPRVLV